MQRKVKPEIAADNGITEGVIWKQLLSFFFPILLGTFFQQLYNTADAIIVGKFVGKESLAAVGGATGTILNLLVGFFVGLSSGASVIISQYFGARKNKEVSDSVHTAAALAISAGLFMTVLSIAFLPSLLKLMGTPEEIMAPATTYIRIFSLGMLPSLIYNIGSGILRAIGDSRRPLFFLICSCMTNILLDIILVVGLEMGVAGAALATILSQLLSAVLVVITLMRSPMSYQLFPRKIRFHGDLLRRVVQIGLPAGLQSVMYSISNVIIQSGVNSFGTDTMAAWTAYGKIDGLFWMTINAFGIAITTFSGQNFGAGKYDRMRQSIRTCLKMAFVTTIVLSDLLLLGGGFLLNMFTDDANVVAIGLSIVRLLVPTYFTYVCIEVLSGAVRGTGDTLVPTLMTLTGICLMRVLWLFFVVPHNRTLPMVLVSYPLTWALTSVLFIAYYLSNSWFKRALKRKEDRENEMVEE